ncbi:MAG: molybdopterin-guanine dinucleotide biosynthesis protein B [Lachnospiraceae bacterium]|nr:molybdopterin-guanine dinucleotide biosynthesis protein B [Lachnospiraceae bacterium]
MYKRPAVIAITGIKNSGKTTLITKLLPILSEKGYKTAVVKHDGHNFDPDVPGTDSYKYRMAGAYSSAVYSSGLFMIIKEQEVSESYLIDQLADADIVLLEGFKTSHYPKIEVIREGNSDSPFTDEKLLLGIATDIKGFKSESTACFDLNNAGEIADEIIKAARIQKENTIGMLLLAGGKSTRMGRSKALLKYKGIPFWRKIAGVLDEFSEVFISISNEEDEAVYEGFDTIRDQTDRIGPIGGLKAAFSTGRYSSFFVCACDMPDMNNEFVKYMIDLWKPLSSIGYEGLFIKDETGRIYTSAGIYSSAMKRRIEDNISLGFYRLKDILNESKVYYFPYEELSEKCRLALKNVNTAEDYKAFIEEKDILRSK